MDKDKLKVLNNYHVIFLIQNVMIGTTVLALPNRLSSMGYSQWWMPLMFGILANLVILPMIWLGRNYPQDNLFVIHEKLLGKWLGKIINVFLLMYFVVVIAAVCDRYMQLIQVVALVDRTITGPLILFLLMLIYIVSGGIKSIARFCIMAFFLTIGTLYFLKWGILTGDIRHLQPFFNFNREEFYNAFKKGAMAVGGFELISFYFPYIINQQKVLKHASLGIWISTLFTFAVTFVSVMYFSEWQLKNVPYPVLDLFKEVELSFIERLDVIGITITVFLILSTAAAYLWVAKKGVDTLHLKTKKYHLYVITAIVFCVVQFPLMDEFQQKVFEQVFYVMYGLMIWPAFLYIFHMLKSKKMRD
jgi:spore germination protein AB